MIRSLRRSAAASVLVLGACGSNDWFGKAEDPLLPGDRISVLSLDRSLEADDELQSLRVQLPPPEPMASWPQAGGLPGHAVHHVGIAGTVPRAVWRRDIGVGSPDDEELLMAQPVIDGNGVVYTIDARAAVTAFRGGDGRLLWNAETVPDDEEGSVLGGGLAYGDGILYAATGFAEVVALEAASGRILWRSLMSGPMRSAPTVSGGRLFVITVDNRTHALDAATGEKLWTHRGIVEGAAVLGAASPAVDVGVVVTAYSSGEVVALREDNGRVLWSDSLTSVRRTNAVSAISDVRGRPVIDRGLVIATANSGVTVGIDLRTGARTWEIDAGGIQSPWVAGDYVFLIDNAGNLICATRAGGRIRWSIPLRSATGVESGDDPIVWAGPVLVSDRLILTGSHGRIVSVSPYTGDLLGQVSMSAGISLSPGIAGDTLYFITENAELIAFR